MERTVEDPATGFVSAIDGASDAGREGDIGSPRRGRRRRGGKRRKTEQVSAPAQPLAEPSGRPENIEEESDRPRKRKRRRKRRGQGAVGASAETTSEAQAGEHNQHQSKKRHGRGRRGLQGRPLSKSEGSAKRSPNAANDGRTEADQPRQSTQQARPSNPTPELYAALDLGTNNCRLLIAQPTRPGQFRVVDAFSRIVRLGEGLGASGRLSQDAMDRAVEALKVCSAKLRHRDIRRHRLIATEACRAAENGEEFLQRVAIEAGLELEIINRETEARLAVSGCSSLVGRETRSVVLFDIGGGSSEIAVIRAEDRRSRRLANHITHWTSLPVGVVTLSERFGGRDVTPDVFAAMVGEVDEMLKNFESPAAHELAAPDTGFHLIGTSGTVTTLAGVHLGLDRYDRRKVDGLWLSDDEVTAMQSKLLSWDFAARASNPCIGPDRADLVLAGCAILEAIRRRWPSERMRVADRGLREGLLIDMMADDGVWRRIHHRRHNRRFNGGQQ